MLLINSLNKTKQNYHISLIVYRFIPMKCYSVTSLIPTEDYSVSLIVNSGDYENQDKK